MRQTFIVRLATHAGYGMQARHGRLPWRGCNAYTEAADGLALATKTLLHTSIILDPWILERLGVEAHDATLLLWPI